MAGSRKGSDGFANPFKQLKGFCVSPSEAAPPQKKIPPIEPPAEQDGDLFAREMERLGVQGKRVPSAEHQSQTETTAPSEVGDQELFLDAVGRLDAVFEDEFPPDGEEGAVGANPRRMKLVRRGRLAPEAKLDLHGLTREEARTKTRHFLENSTYRGLKTVLIITGRGKGSGGEPVLRGELERYLSQEGRAWVSEWGRSPRQYGGEGALVVFLKG